MNLENQISHLAALVKQRDAAKKSSELPLPRGHDHSTSYAEALEVQVARYNLTFVEAFDNYEQKGPDRLERMLRDIEPTAPQYEPLVKAFAVASGRHFNMLSFYNQTVAITELQAAVITTPAFQAQLETIMAEDPLLKEYRESEAKRSVLTRVTTGFIRYLSFMSFGAGDPEIEKLATTRDKITLKLLEELILARGLSYRDETPMPIVGYTQLLEELYICWHLHQAAIPDETRRIYNLPSTGIQELIANRTLSTGISLDLLQSYFVFAKQRETQAIDTKKKVEAVTTKAAQEKIAAEAKRAAIARIAELPAVKLAKLLKDMSDIDPALNLTAQNITRFYLDAVKHEYDGGNFPMQEVVVANMLKAVNHTRIRRVEINNTRTGTRDLRVDLENATQARIRAVAEAALIHNRLHTDTSAATLLQTQTDLVRFILGQPELMLIVDKSAKSGKSYLIYDKNFSEPPSGVLHTIEATITTARQALVSGVAELANTVQTTLGNFDFDFDFNFFRRNLEDIVERNTGPFFKVFWDLSDFLTLDYTVQREDAEGIPLQINWVDDTVDPTADLNMTYVAATWTSDEINDFLVSIAAGPVVPIQDSKLTRRDIGILSLRELYGEAQVREVYQMEIATFLSLPPTAQAQRLAQLAKDEGTGSYLYRELTAASGKAIVPPTREDLTSNSSTPVNVTQNLTLSSNTTIPFGDYKTAAATETAEREAKNTPPPPVSQARPFAGPPHNPYLHRPPFIHPMSTLADAHKETKGSADTFNTTSTANATRDSSETYDQSANATSDTSETYDQSANATSDTSETYDQPTSAYAAPTDSPVALGVTAGVAAIGLSALAWAALRNRRAVITPDTPISTQIKCPVGFYQLPMNTQTDLPFRRSLGALLKSILETDTTRAMIAQPDCIPGVVLSTSLECAKGSFYGPYRPMYFSPTPRRYTGDAGTAAVLLLNLVATWQKCPGAVALTSEQRCIRRHELGRLSLAPRVQLLFLTVWLSVLCDFTALRPTCSGVELCAFYGIWGNTRVGRALVSTLEVLLRVVPCDRITVDSVAAKYLTATTQPDPRIINPNKSWFGFKSSTRLTLLASDILVTVLASGIYTVRRACPFTF